MDSAPVGEDSIILLATDCDSTRIVYNYLKNHFHVEKVVFENKIDRKHLIKRRIKKLGWLKVAGQLLFQTAVTGILKKGSQKRIEELMKQNHLDASPVDEKLVMRIGSVNDKGVTELLNGLTSKVIVVNGTRIISKTVLSSVSKTFINTHLGITPKYRGVHGGYWALTTGDKESFGATVHVVDPGIDTGDVIGVAVSKPEKEDNFLTYPYLQLAAVLPVICDAVRKALDGQLTFLRNTSGESRLYYHPTIWDYFYYRFKKGVR